MTCFGTWCPRPRGWCAWVGSEVATTPGSDKKDAHNSGGIPRHRCWLSHHTCSRQLHPKLDTRWGPYAIPGLCLLRVQGPHPPSLYSGGMCCALGGFRAAWDDRPPPLRAPLLKLGLPPIAATAEHLQRHKYDFWGWSMPAAWRSGTTRRPSVGAVQAGHAVEPCAFVCLLLLHCV